MTHHSTAFLFAFFRKNGETGVFLASSNDGMCWQELNGGNPVLIPNVGGMLTRDPSICIGPDGRYHMVWTTGWGDRGFGLAHSEDLLTWSQQSFIPVNADEPAARNTWAPEISYNNGEFLVVWSTTIDGHFQETLSNGDMNHRLYCSVTKDFQSWSPKRLYYDGGFNVIDGFLFRTPDRYGLIVKDETLLPVPQKNLRVVWSKDGPFGPWAPAEPAFTDTTDAWAEGPTVLNNGEGWLVYYDKYNDGGYGALQTLDFKTFKPLNVQLPEGIRHGTILRIDSTFRLNALAD